MEDSPVALTNELTGELAGELRDSSPGELAGELADRSHGDVADDMADDSPDDVADDVADCSSESEALRDAFGGPAEDDAIAARARAQIEARLFGGLPSTPAEPEIVGRYQIEGQLGAGGMGVVYRAYDPELDRRVAVKLLREDAVADERARQRMLREARSMARLAHPNVIHVYDVGIVGDQVFVAMELVIGVSLGAWLMSAPRSWREVLDRFLAAGEGLHAAHVAGLIHRDFKPENVLVAADGRVRVLDFGLARSAVQSPVSEGPVPTSGELDLVPEAHAATFRRTLGASLTRTGALLGTPRYMSPELCLGRPADARSDLFAFCVALYEGLYGRAPFKGDTVEAYLQAVVAGEVCEPPKDDNSVPPWIWPVIERGLAADPDARYTDMSVLLAALRPQESATKRGFMRPLLLGAGLVAVLGLVALGTWPKGQAVSNSQALSADASGLEMGTATGITAAIGSSVPAGSVLTAAATTDTDTDTGGATPAGAGTAGTGTAGTGTVGMGTGTAGTGTGTAGTSTAGTSTGSTSTDGPRQAVSGSKKRTTNAAKWPLRRGWCYLGEDHYKLIRRMSKRRSKIRDDEGRCFSCRVEARAARVKGFKPDDCAHYQLCAPVAAEECDR